MLHHHCSQALCHIMTLNPLYPNSVWRVNLCLEIQWWHPIFPSKGIHLFPFICSYIHLFIHTANAYQAYFLAGPLLGTENTDKNETHSILEAHAWHGKLRLHKLEQLNKGNQLVWSIQDFIQDHLTPSIPATPQNSHHQVSLGTQ